MRSNKMVTCPHCGETISPSAPACPYCGSDERTGWSENTYLDGIDIGDEIDYNEIHRKEFSSTKGRKIPLWQLVSGALLLVLFLLAIIRSLL